MMRHHIFVLNETQPCSVVQHGLTLQDGLCSVLCACLVHRNIFNDCYSDTQNNPDIHVGLVTLVGFFMFMWCDHAS